jgi:hypothetical protein
VKGRDHSVELDVNGRIVLEFILGKQGDKVWTESISPRIGISVSSCEHGNITSGYMKGWEFD